MKKTNIPCWWCRGNLSESFAFVSTGQRVHHICEPAAEGYVRSRRLTAQPSDTPPRVGVDEEIE